MQNWNKKSWNRSINPTKRTGFYDKSAIYHTAYWKELSRIVFKRDDFKCQMCFYSAETPSELVAHHIKLRCEGGNNFPDNLITLCHDCHTKLHRLDHSRALVDKNEFKQKEKEENKRLSSKNNKILRGNK